MTSDRLAAGASADSTPALGLSGPARSGLAHSGDERVRLLVEQLADHAVLFVDPQGRIATWNVGAERICGYSADEAIGQELAILYPPEARAAGVPKQELEHVLAKGRLNDESRRVRKTGEPFWASTVTSVVRQGGRAIGFSVILRDVSDGRAALEALRQSEERMRVMVAAVRDYAIYMLDTEGRVVSWNPGAERLKGYTADEIIGRSFATFYTDIDRERQHPQYELRRATAEGRYEEEGWRVRKDGTRFWANVVISAVFDPQGRHVGFTKVTRDFTERRLAEERLRESEERFRLIIGSVRDYAIFMLDPTGHVTTWNAGAEAIKGYRADEIIGKHFSVFYRPDEAAAGRPERELRIARAEGRYEEEGWRVRKDGKQLWVNVVLTAIYDDRGELRGFAKVTRDLTERRRLEEEAREADRKAAEERERTLEAQLAVKVRDEFLTIAAHELRTPLTALHLKLQGLREMIARSAAQANGGGAKMLERFASADRQVGRLGELIERLLDVSRIAGGRFTIQREPMDLAAVVREILEDFRDPAHHVGSELRVDLPPAATGNWDKGRVEQVVVNLLTNAIKYGGGNPIDVRIEQGGALTRLVVRDGGIGIAEGDLQRIFGRFERAVPSSNYSGLGLGLYITRHIVDAHGGSIRVTSEPAKGSTFVVELPRALSDEAQPITQERRA